MAEEFQGGVCGSMWYNPPLNSFSGGGASGFSSPCSVAQLGGGYDMGSFGWPCETTKNKPHNNQVCDNSLGFLADMGSTLDILGFGLSPTSSTTDWNQQNLFCNSGNTEGNYDCILQDNIGSRLGYGMGANSTTMMNSSNFCNNNNNNQDGSPPMSLTASSNSSGDSSTITCEGGLATSFPMNSSASFLIQTLFDDVDESQPVSQINNPNNYGSSCHELMSPCSWVESSTIDTPSIQAPRPSLQLPVNNKLIGEMNLLANSRQVSNGEYNTATALSNIRASLLNSLQSRSRAPTFNQKSHSCANLAPKMNNEDLRPKSKNNINNDQPPAKRTRIEAPSHLPTFKVRKEKLGDRITALQQLVSPFGKTDTASVLHEAIEYIKFLHDQVHVLGTPYLKNNGAAMQHQQGQDRMKDNNESSKQDLRSRGLCLVPISSTYPVTQETPVDFWTPTFGGTTFR